MLNIDFKDMLSALSGEGVEFLLVGAYALAAHGRPRATGDLDIWVHPSRQNAQRLWRALQRFGAPLQGMSPEEFTTPGMVFQVGVAPCRIDLMTSIDGVEFDEAWPHRMNIAIENLGISVIGRAHLILNKRAVGRPQDLADAAWLEGAPGDDSAEDAR